MYMTKEMVEAGVKAWLEGGVAHESVVRNIYSAMEAVKKTLVLAEMSCPRCGHAAKITITSATPK